MKRTYFYWAKLETGEYVNLIYESSYRKGTWLHENDLFMAVFYKGIKLADRDQRDIRNFIFLLNDKNKDEQCFDDYRTIVL